MRRTRFAALFTACALPLVLCGQALGKVTYINPPGAAGPNQYSEVIPTSGGNAAPPGSAVPGSGSATAGPGALAPFGDGRQGDASLAKLGKAGKAAAGLAAATAPVAAAGAGASGGGGGAAHGGGGVNAAATAGGSTASGVADALTGSDAGGLGLLLPLLLATALVAALGILAVRLRARTHPS